MERNVYENYFKLFDWNGSCSTLEFKYYYDSLVWPDNYEELLSDVNTEMCNYSYEETKASNGKVGYYFVYRDPYDNKLSEYRNNKLLPKYIIEKLYGDFRDFVSDEVYENFCENYVDKPLDYVIGKFEGEMKKEECVKEILIPPIFDGINDVTINSRIEDGFVYVQNVLLEVSLDRKTALFDVMSENFVVPPFFDEICYRTTEKTLYHPDYDGCIEYYSRDREFDYRYGPMYSFGREYEIFDNCIVCNSGYGRVNYRKSQKF